MVTQSKFDYHKHLVWIARRCNIGPRRRVNLHVGPLQSCRELLPTASPWLLDDCTGSGRPIDIGVPLSNRPRRLGPYHMVGCQGRVAHTYWALMTNITATSSNLSLKKSYRHPLSMRRSRRNRSRSLTALKIGGDSPTWLRVLVTENQQTEASLTSCHS